MADAIWWYEWQGRQAGPVEHGALVELVRSGQLGGEARIWRSGMSGWEALRDVPEVAMALPPAPPAPAAATVPPPSAAPSPPDASGLPEGMEPVSTGALFALGLVTAGLYPVVKFYRAGVAYQALAGRPSRFTTWFWLATGLWLALCAGLSVGLALGGGPLQALGGVPGFAAHLAAVAFTVLTLFELLALRAEVVKQRAVAPVLTSDRTHMALFICGLLTWWSAIGLVLLAFQGVKLFQDHRALGDALRALRAASPPVQTIAPLVPGMVATPGGRSCAGCGNALAPPARFCDRCGRAVDPR